MQHADLPGRLASYRETHYTVKEAAEVLSRNAGRLVSVATVHRLAREGRLSCVEEPMPSTPLGQPRYLRMILKESADAYIVGASPLWSRSFQSRALGTQSRAFAAYLRGDI
jgi:hypothetical protein